MKKNKLIRNVKKVAGLAYSQPSLLLTRVKANLALPFLPDMFCDISVNGIRFRIDPSVAPMMKEICYGFYETEITSLLKKYIRPGDTCIDVGANIGYISAFMLGLVGKEGAVHSFEPVPRYFEFLNQVKKDNSPYPLFANQAALGETDGTAAICVTNKDNIGWNTMVPNFMAKSAVKEEVEIPVKRLDGYVKSNRLEKVRLIKIDTEGFEFPVLKGTRSFLESTNEKPILIVEIALNAYPKLGTSLGELKEFMTSLGYESFSTETLRPLDISTLNTGANVLYLPSSL